MRAKEDTHGLVADLNHYEWMRQKLDLSLSSIQKIASLIRDDEKSVNRTLTYMLFQVNNISILIKI